MKIDRALKKFFRFRRHVRVREGGRLPRNRLRNADAIITPNEVSEYHGTGVILRRMFRDQRQILSVRSGNLYHTHDFGAMDVCIRHHGLTRAQSFQRVLEVLHGNTIQRILCVPFEADDLITALALKESFNAALCIYLMDDNNIFSPGIPDDLMSEALGKANLRLAISPELQDEYQRKFGQEIHLLPPLVERSLLQMTPQPAAAELLRSRTGVLLGNVWSQRWLDRLKQTVAGAGVKIHWYGNTQPAWLHYAREELDAAGIRPCGFLPEQELIAKLRTYPYALVPSGSLDSQDDRPGMARLSLPSRMPYLLAVANIPMVVPGDLETAASRFAKRFGIGQAVAYDGKALRAAIEEICQPAQQQQLRQNAAKQAKDFCLEDPAQWLWNSLVLQKPATDQFQSQRSPAVTLLNANEPMVRVATVEEWWAMTKQYPEYRPHYRRSSSTPLKDYGYLALFHHLAAHRPARVLEFGHGFNSSLFERFQDTLEMWGVDDCQGLHYFPSQDEWEKQYQERIVAKCPRTHLVRGIVGKSPAPSLPEEYFDLVCSVSVLEELPVADVTNILRQVHRYLRPGGMIINSYDWLTSDPHRYSGFIQAHHEAGFELGFVSTTAPAVDFNRVLLENCTIAMGIYQESDGEDRHFRGPWTTLLVKARRKGEHPHRQQTARSTPPATGAVATEQPRQGETGLA